MSTFHCTFITGAISVMISLFYDRVTLRLAGSSDLSYGQPSGGEGRAAGCDGGGHYQR
jgi:hypothetical protein